MTSYVDLRSYDNATTFESLAVLALGAVTNASSPAQNGSAGGGDGGRSTGQIVAVAMVLGVIIITTILGNLLVCMTIIKNKRMQSPTNLFILSLATTDLFLGVAVLPLSAMSTLRAHWPLGGTFCNIYISFDVTLCTVSIIALFAISLDRYFAVALPLRYQQRMTSRVAWKVIAAIWLFSALMGFVPIHLGWNTPDLRVQNTGVGGGGSCDFSANKPYVLLIALGTYFCPLVVMCIVYMKILRITKQQVKKINQMTRVGVKLDRNTVNGARPRLKQKDAVSDTKAMVTLASIVIAFALCWVPYFTLFTARPFLSESISIDPHLNLFVLWLGYFNSAINPFLYAFYNSQFRDAFIRILLRHSPERKQQLLKFFRDRKERRRSLRSSSTPTEMSVLRKCIIP